VEPTAPSIKTDADITFTGFCFDSRRARAGELFVALKTDRGDGHDFVPEALARGCTGALIDEGRMAKGEIHAPPIPPEATIVSVPDTFKALSDYASYIVRRRKLPIVAVTGSVGKTSTREAVAAVLSRRYCVFRNPANFNGRLGLPIALGALEPQHEMLVLEMATDAPGEIAELCAIAPPEVGIVTRVSEAHLAYFGSLEAIAREKGALVEALPPDGLAILNRDDPRVWAMRTRTRARVLGVSAASPLKLAAVIAAEVGRQFGVPGPEIESALQALPALPGRLTVLPGVNDSILIDDTFSASPASMRTAVEMVMSRQSLVAGDQPPQPLIPNPHCRTFLVLGDMDQLGDESVRLHREIGTLIATPHSPLPNSQLPAPGTYLITYGELAHHIADAALDAGMDPAHVVTTYVMRDAIGYVKQHARTGDVVLVKGDISTRMERVTAALLADPADVSRLVRQEPGWESVRVSKPARPTWLEVDLDAIAHNVRTIKQFIGDGVALMAVLKADGYGHGAVKVARTALNNGAGFCGVASLNEATVLRTANIDEPILILGYTPAWHARDALMRDVSVTVYDLDIARAFSRAALELHRTARVHVKVDSGMGRLGVLPDQAATFIRAVADLPGIEIEGVFTHFCCADTDLEYTRVQLARFLQVVQVAGIRGAKGPKRQTSNDKLGSTALNSYPSIPYLHAANSAATLTLPESHLDMVRVGLAMYGLSPFSPVPSPEPTDPIANQQSNIQHQLRPELRPELRPALSWKTTIAQVKTLPPGHPVSYGATYRCSNERRIAVIPVGYADGFRRAPSNFGEVLVRGQRAPIVGRVCMDQTMIDVTGIPGVRIGDEVVLIGPQGRQSITAEDVAVRLGTINYEVVSAILARVPRVT
jgi:alanine racemase